jgi:hypothetical protein
LRIACYRRSTGRRFPLANHYEISPAEREDQERYDRHEFSAEEMRLEDERHDFARYEAKDEDE